jgi:DNA-binding transcriptional regulator YhcF (GntR family)
MDFVLSRKGGVPLHDQLLAQLELRILTGVLQPGARLPSVRVIARRHGLHANTVSAAYRALEAAGHVELRRGAGVYVRAGSPASLEDARGLDELIRLALRTAFRKGYTGGEIRTAVERWLRAAPPERVVVVDPRRETLELVAHEIRSALGVPVAGCTLEELDGEPVRCAPGAHVETIRVEGSEDDQQALRTLPEGSTVLFVSSSPILLQIAQAIVGGIRGDELLIEGRLVSRRAEWRRLLPAADLVFADALAASAVREHRPRRLRELRLVADSDLEKLRRALGRAETAA